MCRHLKSSSEKIQTSPNPNNKPKKTDNGEFEQLLLPDKSLRIWCNWCYSEWIVLGLILKLNCLSCVWGGGEVVTGAVKPIGESSEKHKEETSYWKSWIQWQKSHAARASWSCIHSLPKKNSPWLLQNWCMKGGKYFPVFQSACSPPKWTCNSCTDKSNCVLYLNLEATLLGQTDTS